MDKLFHHEGVSVVILVVCAGRKGGTKMFLHPCGWVFCKCEEDIGRLDERRAPLLICLKRGRIGDIVVEDVVREK